MMQIEIDRSSLSFSEWVRPRIRNIDCVNQQRGSAEQCCNATSGCVKTHLRDEKRACIKKENGKKRSLEDQQEAWCPRIRTAMERSFARLQVIESEVNSSFRVNDSAFY